MSTISSCLPPSTQAGAILQDGGIGAIAASASVNKLLKKGSIRESDVDDATQEVKISIFNALPHYNPTRGRLDPYISKIAKNAAFKFAKSLNAKGDRTARPISSLSDELGDGHGRPTRYADVLTEDASLWKGGRLELSDRVSLAMDVREVVDGFPPKLQAICKELQEGTQRQAAQSLGISRGTLGHHIDTLRQKFSAAGLSPSH